MSTTIESADKRPHPHAERGAVFVSMRQLRDMTGLGEMTIRRMMERGQFPHAVRLSPQRVAWRATDIRAWIASRVEVA